MTHIGLSLYEHMPSRMPAQARDLVDHFALADVVTALTSARPLSSSPTTWRSICAVWDLRATSSLIMMMLLSRTYPRSLIGVHCTGLHSALANDDGISSGRYAPYDVSPTSGFNAVEKIPSPQIFLHVTHLPQPNNMRS